MHLQALRRGSGVLWCALVLQLTQAPAAAQSPVERGQAIASRLCARCHAIGPEGASPLGIAPPFRELPKRYPVEQLAEALAEGIVTGHPEMPRFVFTPAEIDSSSLSFRAWRPKRHD